MFPPLLCFAVPMFEEHPDISQGVPRQVRPAQQWAVWPLWPLWCQGLWQGELNITRRGGCSSFQLLNVVHLKWHSDQLKTGPAQRLRSNYSGCLETWSCLCPWWCHFRVMSFSCYLKSEDVVCYDCVLLDGLSHKLQFYDWFANNTHLHFIIFHKIPANIIVSFTFCSEYIYLPILLWFLCNAGEVSLCGRKPACVWPQSCLRTYTSTSYLCHFLRFKESSKSNLSVTITSAWSRELRWAFCVTLQGQ